MNRSFFLHSALLRTINQHQAIAANKTRKRLLEDTIIKSSIYSTAVCVRSERMAEDPEPGRIYVDTQHEDLVHDAQLDYYGCRLATCSSGKRIPCRCNSSESVANLSSDRTIKIYNVSETSYELSATLQGHEGPVWQVSWSHPKFGVLLASCSFDGSVFVHQRSRKQVGHQT